MVASKTFAAGTTTIDFTRLAIEIPVGTKDLTIKADLAGVGHGVSSGQTIELDVQVMRARGKDSGAILAAGDNITGGNALTVRQTVATVTKVANPIALTGGTDEVLRFTVSADARGDVTLRSITVRTVITTAAAAAPRAITVLEGTRVLGSATTAAVNDTTTVIGITPPDLVIAAGASRTLRVTLATTGLTAVADRVTASIVADVSGAPVTSMPAATATGTVIVPAGVTLPADLTLNIDGVAITLAPGDTTAVLVAGRIRAATFPTVTVTGTGADLIFTNRVAGTVGNRTVAMIDPVFTGGTIPVITMIGGTAVVAQVDTGTITAVVGTVYTVRITPAGMTARDFTHTAPAGATAITIATALMTLINADIPLPVTASVGVGGILVLTADVAGPAGGFTSANLGPGVIAFTTVPPAAAAFATVTVAVPAGVTPPADPTLDIDGATITLAPGDTAAGIADRIRAAVNARVGRTVTVAGTGTALIFTHIVAGAAGNRTVAMTDAAFTGGTIPTITMAGGADAVAGANFIWHDGAVDIHSFLVPVFPVTGDTLRP
ncbi:MAG: hypothetical protein DDT29_02420 [Dehalococcoidia bacterium]|nr:hypothetical protein [Bacillota bacterium]